MNKDPFLQCKPKKEYNKTFLHYIENVQFKTLEQEKSEIKPKWITGRLSQIESYN